MATVLRGSSQHLLVPFTNQRHCREGEELHGMLFVGRSLDHISFVDWSVSMTAAGRKLRKQESLIPHIYIYMYTQTLGTYVFMCAVYSVHIYRTPTARM